MHNILLFFQSGTAAANAAANAAKQAEPESLFELLAHSTFGLIIMVCLLLMSIVAVSIFVSRYMTIKKATQIDESFMNNIRAHVQNGNIGAARALCQSTDSPIARMVEKGLMRIGKPLDDIEHAIENVGKLEIFKLEKNTNILAIIAGVAPMFGFLGTIAGMITTFKDLSTAESLSISTISGGIYIKMFTSAGGLIVGIFAFVAYSILNTMIDRIVNNMETSTFNFIDLLQEPTG
jgi:biopolymer transport protein ExbB